MKLNFQGAVRPVVYTWIIIARYGTPILPHVFCSARATWNYDKGKMLMTSAALAAVQLVPGGTGEIFIKTLEEYAARAKGKKDDGTAIICDLSRSIEMRGPIARRVPGIALARVTGGQEDDWLYPARLCGRVLLMSRLQAWLTDRRLVSALPSADDPNMLNWTKVRAALAEATGRPPKSDADPDSIADPLTTNDDVTLAVAQVTWWAESNRPNPLQKDSGNVKRFFRPNHYED